MKNCYRNRRPSTITLIPLKEKTEIEKDLTFASTERNSSKQRSGFDSRSSLYCFRFFFDRLGCYNCEDHVHFHLFIRSSIYDLYIPSHNEVNLLNLLLTEIQIVKLK